MSKDKGSSQAGSDGKSPRGSPRESTGVPPGKGAGKPPVHDTNSRATGSVPEQEKVWEEEGGSPPEQISSTKAVKPTTASKAGSMGPAKD